MRAILLAAGKASRLGEISQTTPKALLKVGGIALIDRVMAQLTAVGVKEFLINTHHLAEQVWAHVDAAPWSACTKVVFEEQLLGTLGTLSANAEFFEGEPGWVLHADNFIDGPLKPMAAAFAARPLAAWGAMLTFEADDPTSCGVVMTDADHIMTAFFEKDPSPPSRTASAATFLFDTPVLRLVETLPPEATDISRDLLPLLAGRMVAVPSKGRVIDIGTPSGLAAARRWAGRDEGSRT